MATDSRTVIAVAEFEDRRYWQCWADSDSTIVIEVVSNAFIRDDARTLSESDERRLRYLGFTEPSEGPKPNWRFETRGLGDLSRLLSLTRSAVNDVLGERPANIVDVRTWEHQRPIEHTQVETTG